MFTELTLNIWYSLTTIFILTNYNKSVMGNTILMVSSLSLIVLILQNGVITLETIIQMLLLASMLIWNNGKKNEVE